MKVVSRVIVVLMTLIAVAVWTQVPDRRLPDIGIGPDRVLPTSEACPVVTGRDARSEVTVAADLPGSTQLVVTAGGVELGEVELATDDPRSGATFDLSGEFGASTVGLVVDLPAGGGAASIVTASDLILTAAVCTPPSPGEVAIAGVSTASGEALDLVLANPYTNDAVVEIRTVSEAGVDSASELESVLIPARSVVVVDLAQILPLRNRLSIEIVPARGVVHAAAVQSSGNERMVVEAVEPGGLWLLPIPGTGIPPIVTIFPTQGLDVDYTVDAFGVSGLTESVSTGTIAADQHFVLDSSQLPEGTSAIRVTTTGASVVSSIIEGETIRAGTPGASTSAAEWLVPGSAGPGGTLRIANTSGLDAQVVVRSLAGDSEQTVTIPAGGTSALPVAGIGPGYRIVSDSDVFVAWSVSSDAGFGLAVGRPVLTAGE